MARSSVLPGKEALLMGVLKHVLVLLSAALIAMAEARTENQVERVFQLLELCR